MRTKSKVKKAYFEMLSDKLDKFLLDDIVEIKEEEFFNMNVSITEWLDPNCKKDKR